MLQISIIILGSILAIIELFGLVMEKANKHHRALHISSLVLVVLLTILLIVNHVNTTAAHDAEVKAFTDAQETQGEELRKLRAEINEKPAFEVSEKTSGRKFIISDDQKTAVIDWKDSVILNHGQDITISIRNIGQRSCRGFTSSLKIGKLDPKTNKIVESPHLKLNLKKYSRDVNLNGITIVENSSIPLPHDLHILYGTFPVSWTASQEVSVVIRATVSTEFGTEYFLHPFRLKPKE